MADWTRICERVGLRDYCVRDRGHVCMVIQPQLHQKIDKELDKLDLIGCVARKIYFGGPDVIIKFHNLMIINLSVTMYVSGRSVYTKITHCGITMKMDHFLRDWDIMFNIIARYKKEYARAIAALLPQPIAEEIAAEFSLY